MLVFEYFRVNGTITAGSGSVYANRRNVVIKGTNNNSGINFGTNPLKVNGNLNLKLKLSMSSYH